ncbi:MAG: alpha/beta hydrolase [Bryobacteraceae bacterium]|nr:alpha/beta hydrolase [Bryobacteraceae bacterium]
MHLLLLSALFLADLARPDGVRIHYELSGAGDTTLVFVHGWGSDSKAWREQATYFASTYQVVTLDLAGHGQSTGGRRKVWTLPALAEDVRAVVERLKRPRVILVGHSMGGPVSLLAAAKLPNVQAVILVDTLHNAEARVTPEEMQGYIATFEKDFRGTMTQMVAGMFPSGSPLAAEVTTQALKTRPEMLLALLKNYPQLDLAATLKAVRVPIRAINSAKPATNLAVNRKYADFDATVLNEGGHYLMLERPGEFNAMLREWLSVLR